jgi:hypothetical protein
MRGVDCGDERAKGVKDKTGPTTRGHDLRFVSAHDFHFGFLRDPTTETAYSCATFLPVPAVHAHTYKFTRGADA